MVERARILIVDDEPNIRRLLEGVLGDEGYRTESVGDAESLRVRCREVRVDLALVDVCLPGISGVEWLESGPVDFPVIMMSGHANIDLALRAVRSGAVDFLEKPITADRLLLSVANALERSRLAAENERLRRSAGDELLGESEAMRTLRAAIDRIAPTDATVLVTGESGSGKELVARALHRRSGRSRAAMVQVNCAAIPDELLESELFGHEKGAFTGADRAREGRFALADGGTLLLDEIGDMPAGLQAKLLRVLEDSMVTPLGADEPRRVDVRLVCATHADLETAVADGRFREDLYHRICVVPLRVPPLREHLEDLELYARTFLEHFCARLGRGELQLAPDALAALRQREWRGNVRELRNLLHRVAILAAGPVVGAAELDDLLGESPRRESASRGTLAAELEALERRLIREAVDEAGQNLAEAARTLGVDRANLHRRMKRLQIERR